MLLFLFGKVDRGLLLFWGTTLYIGCVEPHACTVAPKVDVDHRYRGVQEVKRGATLVLPVLFSGSPRPKVTWSHRGVQLTSRPGHVHVETGDGYSTLTVSGIETSEAGKYQVVVDNVAGVAKLDFDVVVKCTYSAIF